MILPAANEANLEDVPEAVRGELDVVTVRSFDEVLRRMLVEPSDAPEAAAPPPARTVAAPPPPAGRA